MHKIRFACVPAMPNISGQNRVKGTRLQLTELAGSVRREWRRLISCLLIVTIMVRVPGE